MRKHRNNSSLNLPTGKQTQEAWREYRRHERNLKILEGHREKVGEFYHSTLFSVPLIQEARRLMKQAHNKIMGRVA